MKTFGRHIVSLFLILAPLFSFCQEKPIMGYKIEEGDVVFTFDKRDYEEVTHDSFGFKRSADNLEIKNVTVAGDFNNWSMKKWRMRKINENLYELRKSIDDFSDNFSWEFKYVINNTYWAEPNKNSSNIAQNRTNLFKKVYNLKMYLAYPDKDGNTCFKLNGFQEAKEVVVAGSFNKWDESLFKMKKVEDGWEITLNINPGKYQYRFIVDGKWMEDPSNLNKTPNEYGEFNSVLDVKKDITFFLANHHDANEVILSGSFNNWDTNKLKMTKLNEGWTYTIPLSGGKHHYKFIVDGNWILDPENPVKEYDQGTHINSVYMVR